MQIIDLSTTTALNILKLEFPIDQFNTIIEATNIDPFRMSAYANEVNNAPFSIQKLRETLYHVGFRKDFDPVTNKDTNFIEITTRFFLYLIYLLLACFLFQVCCLK